MEIMRLWLKNEKLKFPHHQDLNHSILEPNDSVQPLNYADPSLFI